MVIIGQDQPNDREIEYDILVDDGTNRQINIPVGLINYSASNTVLKYLED